MSSESDDPGASGASDGDDRSGGTEPRESVVVPYTELAPELLHAVIESYVLREGTDYGEKEFSLEDKVAHVAKQLKRGDAQIVFDPETETVSIIRR
jgi:hypothetical protein